MLTVESLVSFGANTEEGLNRCMQNESFYLKLVKMIPNDPSFEKLYHAVESGDLEGGFEAAHALKGVLANLSLTPIYEPVAKITELLRARKQEDYSLLIGKIKGARDELAALCREDT